MAASESATKDKTVEDGTSKNQTASSLVREQETQLVDLLFRIEIHILNYIYNTTLFIRKAAYLASPVSSIQLYYNTDDEKTKLDRLLSLSTKYSQKVKNLTLFKLSFRIFSTIHQFVQEEIDRIVQITTKLSNSQDYILQSIIHVFILSNEVQDTLQYITKLSALLNHRLANETIEKPFIMTDKELKHWLEILNRYKFPKIAKSSATYHDYSQQCRAAHLSEIEMTLYKLALLKTSHEIRVMFYDADDYSNTIILQISQAEKGKKLRMLTPNERNNLHFTKCVTRQIDLATKLLKLFAQYGEIIDKFELIERHESNNVIPSTSKINNFKIWEGIVERCRDIFSPAIEALISGGTEGMTKVTTYRVALNSLVDFQFEAYALASDLTYSCVLDMDPNENMYVLRAFILDYVTCMLKWLTSLRELLVIDERTNLLYFNYPSDCNIDIGLRQHLQFTNVKERKKVLSELISIHLRKLDKESTELGMRILRHKNLFTIKLQYWDGIIESMGLEYRRSEPTKSYVW